MLEDFEPNIDEIELNNMCRNIPTPAEQARAAARAMTVLPEHFWKSLELTAILSGWLGTRKALPRSQWNVIASDTISLEVLRGIREHLAEWAKEK